MAVTVASRPTQSVAVLLDPAYREKTAGRSPMHELAIAENVVSSVLERTGGRTVSVVRLRIGRLSGVVPDALTFCFELATSGTPLESATLEIDQAEARGHCRTCGTDFSLADAFLLCDCGSADVELMSGRELLVTSVEVA
jgi:hydrogenase nickel incorporation protein HypA/HybF